MSDSESNRNFTQKSEPTKPKEVKEKKPKEKKPKEKKPKPKKKPKKKIQNPDKDIKKETKRETKIVVGILIALVVLALMYTYKVASGDGETFSIGVDLSTSTTDADGVPYYIEGDVSVELPKEAQRKVDVDSVEKEVKAASDDLSYDDVKGDDSINNIKDGIKESLVESGTIPEGTNVDVYVTDLYTSYTPSNKNKGEKNNQNQIFNAIKGTFTDN